MAIQHAFWLDENFDREHAPDGHNRYGAEVRRRAGEFSDAWGEIAPVTFAVTAWRLATTLSPGYVRWHRRIGELEQTARTAVTTLVRELNELLTPMIGQLEAGVPADS